jgi:hypothetical protein
VVHWKKGEEVDVSRKEALKEYTDAQQEVDIFKEIHREVVKGLDARQKMADEKLQELKSTIREEHEGVENRYFEFTLQERKHRWYDADALKVVLPNAGEFIGLLHTEVDRDILDALVRQGLVPARIAAVAERAEDLTPAVIGRQKQNLASAKAVRRRAPALDKVATAT